MFLVAVGVWLQVQTGVRMGTLVRPETVTVGQHFTAVVRVRAPRGSAIEFPGVADSSAPVAPAAPVQRGDVTGTDYVDATATYTLAAWDVGARPLGLGDVVVRGAAGERRISLAQLRVFVRSVLPADTTRRAPKPPRPGVEEPSSFGRRWLWVVAALLAVLAAALGWLAWRRRKPRAEADPEAWAEREFERIEAMRLLEQGRGELYALLMTGALREYMVRQFASVRRSATTHELAGPLRNEPAVPADRVLALFEQADLVKFAGATVSVDDARGAGAESRAIVRQIAERRRAALAASVSPSGPSSGGGGAAGPGTPTARAA